MVEYPYQENEELYLKVELIYFDGVVNEFAKVKLEDGSIICVKSSALYDEDI